MENPVYRITVEVIGDEKDSKIDYRLLREGVECDGFAILARKGKGGQKAIHDASILDLARIIAADDDLMSASVIAKALREAHDITETKPSKILDRILGDICN